MDYKANKRFFDKEYNKRTNIVYIPASIMFAIGLVITVLGMVGALRWVGHAIGWPVMIVSIIFVFISLSRKVKESDVLAEVDSMTEAVKARCLDALDYPEDAENNSITLVGCIITPENVDKAVKLKSGSYLDTDLMISFIYIKKNALYCFRRTVSLIEEGQKDQECELPFTAFDCAVVESEKIKDGLTVHYIRVKKDGAVVFEAPLTDNDYYKEEFCDSIMHVRERALKN